MVPRYKGVGDGSDKNQTSDSTAGTITNAGREVSKIESFRLRKRVTTGSSGNGKLEQKIQISRIIVVDHCPEMKLPARS